MSQNSSSTKSRVTIFKFSVFAIQLLIIGSESFDMSKSDDFMLRMDSTNSRNLLFATASGKFAIKYSILTVSGSIHFHESIPCETNNKSSFRFFNPSLSPFVRSLTSCLLSQGDSKSRLCSQPKCSCSSFVSYIVIPNQN